MGERFRRRVRAHSDSRAAAATAGKLRSCSGHVNGSTHRLRQCRSRWSDQSRTGGTGHHPLCCVSINTDPDALSSDVCTHQPDSGAAPMHQWDDVIGCRRRFPVTSRKTPPTRRTKAGRESIGTPTACLQCRKSSCEWCSVITKIRAWRFLISSKLTSPEKTVVLVLVGALNCQNCGSVVLSENKLPLSLPRYPAGLSCSAP